MSSSRKQKKKILAVLVGLYIGIILSAFCMPFYAAAAENKDTPKSFRINEPIQLQAPLPIGEDKGEQIEASNKGYLFVYIVKVYRYVATVAGIIAVMMVVIGGFQIAMSRDDTAGVEAGKKRIYHAIEGLAILFTSSILLSTINPQFYSYDADAEILEMYNADVVGELQGTDDIAIDPIGVLPNEAGKDRFSVLAIAASQIGYKEQGNNCTAYNKEIWNKSCNIPWCATYALWTLKRAGYDALAVEAAQQSGGNSKALLKWFESSPSTEFIENKSDVEIKPGDIVIWTTDGEITPGSGHTGIVTSVNKDGINFTSLEGNLGNTVKHASHKKNEKQLNGKKYILGYGRIKNIQDGDLSKFNIKKAAEYSGSSTR